MGQAAYGIAVGKSMDQVFNELSLAGNHPNIYSAHEALVKLEDACKKLHGLGFTRQVRVTEDFATRLLTPEYSIYDYLKSKQGGKNKTLHDWVMRLCTNAPFVEKLCEEEGVNFGDEYIVEEQYCKGLALAALWNVPALSLTGDERFTPPYVVLAHNSIDEVSGEIQQEKSQVGIISCIEDVAYHEKAIADRLRLVETGANLLEYARQRLGRLQFSREAQEQLLAMRRGYPLLPRICSILEELQRAMQEAIESRKPFMPLGFKYTPFESDTATQGKKGEQHTFTFKMREIKQTVYMLCESHMRVTDRERVYFCAGEDVVFVGHIGEHLPGKKYG